MKEGEWPATSSPTKPPKAVLYYGRYIGGVLQDVNAETFAEPWQMGIVLNKILADAEDFEFTHGVAIPWHMDNFIRRLRGAPERSFHTWAGKEDEPRVRRESSEPKPAREPRLSREGKVTLDSLCEGTSWDPSKVRAALRKKGVEKPAGGWVFEEGDERIAIIEGIVGK
jgi:hypothetical protein